MKNKITGLLLSSLLIANSCTTTLMSSKKQNTVDDVLKTGNSYIFFKKDGTREKVEVSTITETEIIGQNPEGKETQVSRNEIYQIKKDNTLGTVGIVAGIVAVAVLLPAYLRDEPVGGR